MTSQGRMMFKRNCHGKYVSFTSGIINFNNQVKIIPSLLLKTVFALWLQTEFFIYILDLALGMRRLHETFVALAGRLQSVHSQVEAQKEAYLNIRKQIYNDYTNPFNNLVKTNNVINTPRIYSPPKVATGPTPFLNLPLGNGNLSLLTQNQAPPAYGASTSSAAPSGKKLLKFCSLQK